MRKSSTEQAEGDEARTRASTVAVDPVTGKAYVSNSGSNNVTVVDEVPVNTIPLQAGIMSLASSMTGSLSHSTNVTLNVR
jgi:DNA-binding beta-propeller fold protein YncE